MTYHIEQEFDDEPVYVTDNYDQEVVTIHTTCPLKLRNTIAQVARELLDHPVYSEDGFVIINGKKIEL